MTPAKPKPPEPPRGPIDLSRVLGEVAALHREGHLRFASDGPRPTAARPAGGRRHG